MKNIYTAIVALVTLLTVGVTQDDTIANHKMTEVEIHEVLETEGSYSILIKEGHENQDIWVHISEDTSLTDFNDNPISPNILQVGDTVNIYFNEVMESYPLQTLATSIKVK